MDERAEYREAELAALAGQEVPFDHLRHSAHRTVECAPFNFARMKETAKSGNPHSVCCVPVLSPVGRVALIW